MSSVEEKTAKDRATGSIHFGDDADFDSGEDYGDATWKEVCNACCVHSGEEWMYIILGVLAAFFFLFFFLVGLEILGDAAKVMTGCTAGELFGDDVNPVAGLMIGILATVLLQSSSTTTSIVVGLVGSAVSVRQGIYMIMGANIGTSVTNTIVAMGQMGDGDQLERAFSGATVHDVFNFGSVIILFPIEIITGFLFHLTKAMVRNAETEKGDKWDGPIKTIVEPIGKRMIISSSSIIKDIAKGEASCEPGGGFYPLNCTDRSASGCGGSFGLIGCDKDSDKCPAFFNPDATAGDDQISGGVCFFIAIVILFTCLAGLVTVLQKLLMGMSTRIIYKATDINGYLGILIGVGLTMLVQSSSITTSTLTPLVGMGALRLEQMLPLTLGANIGTTMTAILAAMVTEGTKSLQVALAHLCFNLTGIIIFYPVPFMRNIPLSIARRLGKATRVWRGFPFVYIAVMFFIIPLILLGISALFEDGSVGLTALGSVLVLMLATGIAYMVYWLKFKEGSAKIGICMKTRERKRVAIRDLPDDMDDVKASIQRLIAHTGLPTDEEVEVEEVEVEEDVVESTANKAIEVDQDDEVEA